MLWTVVLEKMLENPLDGKEITTVNPKGNQLWIFIGRAVSDIWILWPTDAKRHSLEKTDVGEVWRWEETGMTEDEMIWWHHLLNVHEFEQTPRNGEGQIGLAFWSPWGRKESDMTEQLNNNKQWTNSVPASWKGNPSNRIWPHICKEGLTPGLAHYCLILKFLILF